MSTILKHILFFGVICVSMGVCARVFTWFPIDNIGAWIAFAVSFAICTGASILIENAENRKMERALKEYKGE